MCQGKERGGGGGGVGGGGGHIKENKGMVAIILVYVLPTAQAIRIRGLYLSFTSRVAFPLHHRGIFALKGSAPSRVYHLAGT